MFPLWINLLTSSLVVAQVAVYPPDKFVSIPGGDAAFTCFAPSASGDRIVSVQWIVNGSLLDTLVLRGVSTEFSPIIANGIGSLNFNNLPLEYNTTSISCRARFETGVTMTSNNATLLLIQGLLPAVSSLMLVRDSMSTMHISWNPPYTLDIAGISPDIEGYCVQVINSTSLQILYSLCGITATNFSYPVPVDALCFIYMLTVTPVNVVGNGTPKTVSYFETETVPELVEMYKTMATAMTFDVYSITMSAPVCTVKLTFVDLDTGDIITLGDNDLTLVGNNITFTTERLTTNRHYNVTARASNVAGSSTFHFNISIHDISNVDIMERDGIEVTATYFEHSVVLGALFSFVFITESGDVDFTRSALLPLDRNTPPNHTLPFNLHPGHYRIYVYDIEQDGTLYNGVGYPAVTEELFTSGNTYDTAYQPRHTHFRSCRLNSTPNLIRAICTYHSNSSATGFLVVAQLRDSDRVGKLFINQSMNPQTPATIQVERSGVYQVTVFAIRGGRGILDSGVEYAEKIMVSGVLATTTTATTQSTTTTKNIGLTATEALNRVHLTVGIVVPIVVVMFILIIVVVLAKIFIRRRKRSKKTKIYQPEDTEVIASTPAQVVSTPIPINDRFSNPALYQASSSLTRNNHSYVSLHNSPTRKQIVEMGVYTDKAPPPATRIEHPEITEEGDIGPDFIESNFYRAGETEHSPTQPDDSQQPLAFGNQVSAAAGGDVVEEEASQD